MNTNSAGAPLNLVLASPRGFCAGVDRAITIVEKALEMYGAPIYVQHEIVHNKHVVQRLRNEGAVFVENIDEIPEGSHAIFSAHGVSPEVRKRAEKRKLQVLDATCPLVTKVHREAQRYAQKEHTIILIGHHNHVEVKGTVGEAPEHIFVVGTVEEVSDLKIPDEKKVGYITQTTLSLDDTAEIITALKERFPEIKGPAKDDICYATQNRQNAVKALSKEVDLVLVVGAQNSSNSVRLLEVAETTGVKARRIESAAELDPEWLEEVRNVGITAGASAPEDIVQGIVAEISKMSSSSSVRDLEIVQEDVTFALPTVLRNA
ncbi:MAG TPA: 4-hydroxy-3-methylbut-2-enyl diphosphate reductase [Deltaproteobacteria bacterium]|jgi:4-hydroxy-3-methylbut-2-enyl diphosphate reductase|nr:4-hydroxy-3-methylbut-2-enyl diphosphate reductase [SAR324 cluster bacterium]MED5572315.1 4-hydroxy-3-methylbut-2-enyl diphosphate reductase [SAR324 cluster bacterium]HBJ47307.1 4-hydroxy-3-methylbut-2-enyl diphosphate reductase [Deltaproteobacteria bacterium]HIB40226.1 4-hydroxy-3-methylbut-2-enyl diphosphate reductase [Candidatus Lambdaproteobacteria bacterium]